MSRRRAKPDSDGDDDDDHNDAQLDGNSNVDDNDDIFYLHPSSAIEISPGQYGADLSLYCTSVDDALYQFFNPDSGFPCCMTLAINLKTITDAAVSNVCSRMVVVVTIR